CARDGGSAWTFYNSFNVW
nr:immunoglobulin heavy chain junction region [Macaca mulatta]MOV43474.1 immunoglobulin heavy chain junction region [Macaca mulatta]MOV43872.1 immunoglobulin heavy chain junction region [Macaca mulatta]MOV45874.1 immunoglobulin heavy chain junction region [Macaca mulatta]MOV46324.1 immunoglobulin heavy chain junction region [Macaca mulatta]